jgi:hypothetical protein
VLIDTKLNADHFAEERTTRDSRHRWHSVMIVPSSTACFVSQACKRNRYLSSDAPRLPLSGCNADHCNCKYRHYADRRGAPRGAEERGASPARVVDNRRVNPDRRPHD